MMIKKIKFNSKISHAKGLSATTVMLAGAQCWYISTPPTSLACRTIMQVSEPFLNIIGASLDSNEFPNSDIMLMEP